MKNDIKSLAFALMEDDVEELASGMLEERLRTTKAIAEHSNNKKVKTYSKDVARFFDSEAGSDGIEEYVKEAVNLIDVDNLELTQEQQDEVYAEARKQTVEKFVSSNDLGSRYTWVLPQMTAHVGSWKAIKNENGKYDGKATVAEACKEDYFNRGIWYVLHLATRSDLISKTLTPLYKVGEYNNLVPLMLNAFKIYQNILIYFKCI
jgi:hypothetical protein